jgi:hypothetical protein
MGNSNPGLKSQFGVGDPNAPAQNTPNTQDTGSDKQAQEFQAAFQQEQGVINGHLQYTAVSAEAVRHDPLSARRDAMFTAFQSALAKIDRKDPSKAQGAIDQVLSAVRALSGEVAAFRQQAEKAKTDWDSRQGKYDEAVHQTEELVAWEDTKAPALRGLVDGIRNQVNQRQYAQATSTLDQLLPKLAPIYEEYLRQKEAKPQYEQQVAEQSARLAPLKAADRPSQPMTAKAGEADAALQAAKGKADTKDYVAGLESMAKAKGLLDELDTLVNDPQRQQYLADSQAQGQTCEPQPEPPFKILEADWAAISEAGAQAQPLADSGDYGGANQTLVDSKTKRAAFQTKHDELVQQKQSYEDTLAQVQPRLLAVSVSEAQYASLQPMQQALATAQTQTESAAQAEDFGQALTQVQDLSAKVDALEQAKAEIDQKKQDYETALAVLQPRIDAVSVSDPAYAKIEPQLQEITQSRATMQAAAQAGDYDQATTQLQSLTPKVDTYEQAKTAMAQIKQEYETVLAALQPKLPTACPANAKLSAVDSEITTLKGQMEAAATSNDYAKALEIAKQVSAKAEEFQKALAEFEKNKLAYEATLKALQPKLPTTCPANASLAERHSQIMVLKGQMEAAASSQDHAKALELAKQLSAKLDDYQKAVKETPPSPEKVKEVQDLITSGKKDDALQKAMEVYGVDKSQAKKIVYDASVSGEAETSEDGTITVGDKSFSSPGWLASSAAHEAEVHVNKQAKAGKWYTGVMGTAIQEVQAYDHEIANAHKYNLTQAEINDLKKRRKDYYDQLNADYKKRADESNYDMKPSEEGL